MSQLAVPTHHVVKTASEARTCRLAVATSRADMHALVADWQMLRVRADHGSPDADPEFFLPIFPSLGEDMAPHIVIARIDERACGYVIARTCTRRLTQKDYLRHIAPPLKCLEIVYGGIHSDDAAATHALVEHLRSQLSSRAVDLLEIHHLEATHEYVKPFLAGMNVASGVTCVRETNWLTKLIDDDGRQIEHNSSKTRSTFRRKDKRLVEAFDGDVHIQTATSPHDVEVFIKAAASVTTQTYQAALDAGILNTPRWRAILAALAANGTLRGYVMVAGGQPIAYVAGALNGGHFTLLATSFVPAHKRLSPGLVLLNRVIAMLVAEYARVFDFGFGDADYKQLLGSEQRELLLLRLYGTRFRARAAHRVEIVSTAGKGMIRRIMNSVGAFHALKRIWRSRLQAQTADDGEGTT